MKFFHCLPISRDKAGLQLMINTLFEKM